MPLRATLIRCLHQLFLDRVDVLLAGAHAPDQGVILGLEVVAALLDFIIGEGQPDHLLLSRPLRLDGGLRLAVVLVDAGLELAGLRLEATVLLMHAGYLVDVPLADVLNLLDLLLHFLLVVVEPVLQAIVRLRGGSQLLSESGLRGLTLIDLTLQAVDLRPVLRLLELFGLLIRVQLLRHLCNDFVFFRNLVVVRRLLEFELAVFHDAQLERLPLLLEHDVQLLELLGRIALFLHSLLHLFRH